MHENAPGGLGHEIRFVGGGAPADQQVSNHGDEAGLFRDRTLAPSRRRRDHGNE
jgi:hypothetical protein